MATTLNAATLMGKNFSTIQSVVKNHESLTLHRQVLHSGTDPLKRRGGASASVHRQSVLFLVVNRDRYPQVAFMSGLWGHFIDKVVNVPVVTRRGAL